MHIDLNAHNNHYVRNKYDAIIKLKACCSCYDFVCSLINFTMTKLSNLTEISHKGWF